MVSPRVECGDECMGAAYAAVGWSSSRPDPTPCFHAPLQESGFPLSADSLAPVLPVLTELRLRAGNSTWKTEGLSCLGTLSGCPRLRVLQLHAYKLESAPALPSQLEELVITLPSGKCPVEVINSLGTLTNLKTLNLTSGGVADLTPVLACTTLESLSLFQIDSASLPNLGALPALERLDLTLGAWDAGALLPLATCTALTELRLSNGAFNGIGDELAPLAFLTGLVKLDLCDLRFDDDGDLDFFDSLPDILSRLVSLTELDVSQDDSIGGLSSLHCLSTLSQLSTLGLGGESLSSLAELSSLRSSLSLLKIRGADTPLDSLSSLRGCCPLLTSLDIASTSLSSLDGLQDCPLLQSLRIMVFRPDDDALVNTALLSLGGLDQCTQLTALDLSMCAGLTSIDGLNLACASTLTSLSLNGTALSSSSGFLLNTLLSGCSRLTSLNLTAVSALSSLECLHACSGTLTTLTLHHCTSLSSLEALRGRCRQLTTIDLTGCAALASIAAVLQTCYRLKTLILADCRALTSLEGPAPLGSASAFTGCPGLSTLDLSGCTALTSLGGLQVCNARNLTTLDLGRCISLRSLQGLHSCPRLISLDLRHCLDTVRAYTAAAADTATDPAAPAPGCSALELQALLAPCKHLTHLDLTSNTCLTSLEGLSTTCPRLRTVRLEGSQVRLPGTDSLESLMRLADVH